MKLKLLLHCWPGYFCSLYQRDLLAILMGSLVHRSWCGFVLSVSIQRHLSVWEIRSTPTAGTAVPYDRLGGQGVVRLAKTLMLNFVFKELVVKKQSISGKGDFSVSLETGKVHSCIHHYR